MQTLSSQEIQSCFRVDASTFGYLRRDPNNGNGDTDYTGYDFWLTKLNQFGGNFTNADMVKSFIRLRRVSRTLLGIALLN